MQKTSVTVYGLINNVAFNNYPYFDFKLNISHNVNEIIVKSITVFSITDLGNIIYNYNLVRCIDLVSSENDKFLGYCDNFKSTTNKHYTVNTQINGIYRFEFFSSNNVYSTTNSRVSIDLEFVNNKE